MALSPMMKYYLEVKEKYKDAILMFRLGDFYEMFFEDAKLCSEVLDLTLTGRDCGLEERAPMCGVPYHAVDGYISKLIGEGYKVAICEQLSAPQARGLVERDVVRVITPGTVIEDDILDDKKNNYLACLVMNEKEFSLAWVDVSTGEFNVMQSEYGDFAAIEDMLTTVAPAEIIANEFAVEKVRELPDMRKSRFAPVQRYHDWIFTESNGAAAMKKQFGVDNLQKYEFGAQKLCYQSVGALCLYLEETQKRALTHIKDVKLVRSSRYMILDANTRRNLELTANLRDGTRRGTLLKVLDRTRTSMGARNLRRWLEQPLRDSKEINKRLDAVEALVKGARVRSNLDELFALVKDLERLASKVVYGNPSPRDFIAIAQSLAPMPEIKNFLASTGESYLVEIADNIFPLAKERARILDILDENPPATTKDGGFVRKGFSEELDACRSAKTDGKNWLAKLESDERAETGIKTLKVGFNKVFGYYIEVSKGALDKVPIRYVRKQTLTTGERFITEELKQIEDKILNSESRAIEIEIALYEQLKYEMLQAIPGLQSTARAVAAADTLLAFAKLAGDSNYCKPVINDNTEVIEIVGGRHPVVESLLPSGAFVPNDTELDCGQNRTMVITGPNMAGKSTYNRKFCAGGVRQDRDHRPYLHSHRRVGRRRVRTEHVHGRNGRGRDNFAERDDAQSAHSRRDRQRHVDVRRAFDRKGGARSGDGQDQVQDPLFDSLSRTHLARKQARGREKLQDRRFRARQRHRVFAQDHARRHQQEFRHRGRKARGRAQGRDRACKTHFARARKRGARQAQRKGGDKRARPRVNDEHQRDT